MKCETCSLPEMEYLGYLRHWCPKCGSLTTVHEATKDPAFHSVPGMVHPPSPEIEDDLDMELDKLRRNNPAVAHGYDIVIKHQGGAYWAVVGALIALNHVHKERDKLWDEARKAYTLSPSPEQNAPPSQ